MAYLIFWKLHRTNNQDIYSFPTDEHLNFGISCNMLAVEWYKGLCVNSLTNFGKTCGLVRWSLADKGTWRSLARWSTWRWRHKRWAGRTHWYLHTPDPLSQSSQEDMRTGSCRWCWRTQRSDHTVMIHTRRCLRGIRLPQTLRLLVSHQHTKQIFTFYTNLDSDW